MATYIYGLFCPLAQQIRYIGKAGNPQKRLVAHLHAATKPRTHCHRWLSKLAREGLKPSLRIIRQLAADEDWATAEREEIAKGLAAGWALTNLTKGGEGAADNEEGRKRRLARMGNPETRRRMSQSAKARWSDPEKGVKGRAENADPERRAKLSASCTARATPEYRAAQSERGRKVWADPEKRSRIVGGITEETLARVSEASRRAWRASPNMARCLGNLTSEESRRKLAEKRPIIAAKRAALWATPEFRARMKAVQSTPEYRAKMVEAGRRSGEARRANKEKA
jgi:hypothetical protein